MHFSLITRAFRIFFPSKLNPINYTFNTNVNTKPNYILNSVNWSWFERRKLSRTWCNQWARCTFWRLFNNNALLTKWLIIKNVNVPCESIKSSIYGNDKRVSGEQEKAIKNLVVRKMQSCFESIRDFWNE